MNQKEWTIMIYMAGDNNLAVDMAYALDQIKNVAGEGVNLFVYYDGNSPSIPTLYCDFSEPNSPKYVPSYSVEEKLHPVPKKHNENAADDKSVINFVDWCVNASGRHANRHALIFSGHSLGFQDIGLFRDETSGRAMKMTDLYFALQRIVGTAEELEHEVKGSGLRGEERDRETKVLLGKKLDILGFDSCVMGMLEVGYQFQVVADTMISSEGSVPSAGWTYAKILGRLARGGSGSSRAVAENFVRDFIESQDSYTVGGVSVDMAAWDLGQFRELTIHLDVLAETLLECFSDPASRIYRQMERAILQVHWKCQSYMFDQNVDLGDFCELLDRECDHLIQELGMCDEIVVLDRLRLDCQGVLEALRKAVILSGFSGGEYQYSNGVSVFFPWSREGYEASRKNYRGLWFARDAGTRKLNWNGFLKKYLNDVALRKFDEPAKDAPPGSKYRYYSGVPFHEQASNGNGDSTAAAKIAGHEGSKIAGSEGSKLAGQEGSKLAGQEGSKLAGREGSKLAGQEGSKLAGQEGTKLAGGGSNAFFANLRLFKNIESRWNISGFTKNPDEDVAGSLENEV